MTRSRARRRRWLPALFALALVVALPQCSDDDKSGGKGHDEKHKPVEDPHG